MASCLPQRDASHGHEQVWYYLRGCPKQKQQQHERWQLKYQGIKRQAHPFSVSRLFSWKGLTACAGLGITGRANFIRRAFSASSLSVAEQNGCAMQE